MSLGVLIFLAGMAIALMGAVLATSSSNLVKRVVGCALAFSGAVLALGELGAGKGFLIATTAIAFSNLALGVALIIRLKETYGSTELPDIDRADRESEPKEQPN